jgi:hypothetical protein
MTGLLVQISHLTVPVLCVKSGIIGVPFSMCGVMLNTARVMAQDRKTDVSARTRPAKKYELMMTKMGYTFTWAYSEAIEVLNNDVQLFYAKTRIPPSKSEAHFPWIRFRFMVFGLDEPCRFEFRRILIDTKVIDHIPGARIKIRLKNS